MSLPAIEPNLAKTPTTPSAPSNAAATPSDFAHLLQHSARSESGDRQAAAGTNRKSGAHAGEGPHHGAGAPRSRPAAASSARVEHHSATVGDAGRSASPAKTSSPAIGQPSGTSDRTDGAPDTTGVSALATHPLPAPRAGLGALLAKPAPAAPAGAPTAAGTDPQPTASTAADTTDLAAAGIVPVDAPADGTASAEPPASSAAANPAAPGDAAAVVSTPASSDAADPTAATALLLGVAHSSPTAAAPSSARAIAATPAASGLRSAPSATASQTQASLADPSLLAALHAQEQAGEQAGSLATPSSSPDHAATPATGTAAAPSAEPPAQPPLSQDDDQPLPAPNIDPQPLVTALTTDRKSTAIAAAPAQSPDGAGPTTPQAQDSTPPAAPGPAQTSAPANQTNAAASPTPASPAPPAPPVLQVVSAITRTVTGDRQSFTVQLNPEHLGAVEVKLELDAKGHATASFVADHPDTLALLRQDSHHLLQSLQDAGVNADAGSLNFSLRNSGGGFAEAQDRRQNPNSSFRYGGVLAADSAPETAAAATRGQSSTRLYDIRA
jgi:flagellar hook-length control protein FliK